MSESDISHIEEEVLVLQSIYGEEDIVVHYGSDIVTIEMTLHPSTANDVDSQYVYVELQFQVDKHYPEIIPTIIIKSSRGLSDETVSQLLSNMNMFAKDRLGEMVLFDLIEMVKEILTNNNMPWHPCSICLCHFHKCDVIFKTECYHYFHGFCMKQYIDHENTQLEKPNTNSDAVFVCPVCRNEIAVNISSFENAAKPFNDVEDDTDADLTAYQIERQKHAAVYERQKMNGGIIDLEHEKNKNLLSNLEKAFAAAAIEKQESETNPETESPSTSQHNNHAKIQTPRMHPSQRHVTNNRRGGYNRGRARGHRGSYNNRGNLHHRDRRPAPNNDNTSHHKEKEHHKNNKPFNRKTRGNDIPHRPYSKNNFRTNVPKQQHEKELPLKQTE